MRILVTRPQPGADTTAALVRSLGHEVTVAPLLAIEAVDWAPPSTMPSAILLTSANAARLCGERAARFHDLPTFAVGSVTRQAARTAGFAAVRGGDGGGGGGGGGTVQASLDAAATDFADILHLAGADRTGTVIPDGLHVETRTVYRARLLTPAIADHIDIALLYSARTARHFAALWDASGRCRSEISIAAISPAALVAAGAGWRNVCAAATPDEAALLAAAGLTCQKAAD